MTELNPGPNPHTGVGANMPPPDPPTPLDKMILATKAWSDWLAAHPKITTKEESEQAQTHINALRSAGVEADNDRKAINKPWDNLIDANNATFKTPLQSCKDAIIKAKEINGDWLTAEQRRIDAERAEAARKQRLAEEEQRKARAEATAAAAAGDTAKAAEASKVAETAQTEALKQTYYAKPQRAAVKAAGSGRAMTMRDYWDAKIVDADKAISHYAKYPAMREAMLACATKLAKDDAVSFKDKEMAPAGVEFTMESRPV